jgi:hypothetical protein
VILNYFFFEFHALRFFVLSIASGKTLITGIGGLSPLLSAQSAHFVEGSDCLKLVSWFMMETEIVRSEEQLAGTGILWRVYSVKK